MEVLAKEPDLLTASGKAMDILGNIKALKDQQKQLKDQRKVVTKQLRNEEKRRMRLRKRARQLSDIDLLAVIKMRTDAKMETDAVPNADPTVAP